MGYVRSLCLELEHNHPLKPPRMAIVSRIPEPDLTKIYMFNSPIKTPFIVRKALKFTIPTSSIEFDGTIEDIQ